MHPTEEELDEIRRRFGERVPIIDRLPSKTEIIERDSWLEKIAGTVGLEKWMWKSRRGLLIAIIVVPPGIHGLVDFWKTPIKVGMEFARPYVSIIEESTITFGQELVAFLPSNIPTDSTNLYPKAILAPSFGQVIASSSEITQIDATVFRLTHPKYDPLDGRGASIHGGRWNSPGQSVLYASDSVLAAIEELRQHLSMGTIRNFIVHEIHLTATAKVVSQRDPNLLDPNSYEYSREVGDKWLREGEADVLLAPNRVDPSAHTVVINISHLNRIGLSLIRSTPIDIA